MSKELQIKLDQFLRENGINVDFSTLDKLKGDNDTYVYTFQLEHGTNEQKH